MTGHLPSGTVTFLLTDLEASTRMWEQDSVAMKTAMVRHDEKLEKTFAANRGFVFSRMSDGMTVAFATAGDAVAAALAIKHALTEENWWSPSPLKARIGLHTAEAVIADDSGYASLPINRCSLLMSAAHGAMAAIVRPIGRALSTRPLAIAQLYSAVAILSSRCSLRWYQPRGTL
jgi:class 3 adenylate cyclase